MTMHRWIAGNATRSQRKRQETSAGGMGVRSEYRGQNRRKHVPWCFLTIIEQLAAEQLRFSRLACISVEEHSAILYLGFQGLDKKN